MKHPKLTPKRTANGKYWRVNIPASIAADGLRERRFFATKIEAETFSEAQRIRQLNFGRGSSALSASQMEQAVAAFERLPVGVTLAQVIGDWLRINDATSKSVTLAVAWADYVKAKSGSSVVYLKNLRRCLSRLSSLAAKVVARQEYAGYWEYVIDEAIFTAPSHPNWGGTAMIGAAGELLGVGSLQLQQASERKKAEHLNMVVPINLLKPILDDMIRLGRPKHPPRPWLGFYATENEDQVVVVGLAERGPAARADLQTGDVVLAVGGAEVDSLGGLFKQIWSLGSAGVEVPLTISREGRTMEVRVPSSDRARMLKGPTLQ